MRATGNSGSHVVNLWSASSGLLVATATVDCSAGTVDTFLTTAITPVPLAAGDYAIASDEAASGDSWRDGAGSYTLASGFSIINAVFWTSPSTYPFSNATAGEIFVPVGLEFTA